MATTEHERLELYELAKQEVGDRFAELLMSSLPQDPDELVRKSDLDASTETVRSELRTEATDIRAEMRSEFVAVRSEMAAMEHRLDTRIATLGADLRVEMRDLTSAQTRTMMLGLVGSVTALAITEIVINALG